MQTQIYPNTSRPEQLLVLWRLSMGTVLGTGHTFLLLILVSALVLQLADSLSRGCCCKAQVCELQLQGRKLMSQSLTTSQRQPQPSAQDEMSHTEVDGIHLSPHFLRRRDEPQ